MVCIFTSQGIDDKIKPLIKQNTVRKNFEWHYKYVISLVYITPYKDRRFFENNFVPVNYEMLERCISKQEVSNILNNLTKWGILERDGIIESGKSMGYRLINRKSFKWKLNKIADKKLLEKIEKNRKEIKMNIAQRGGGYKAVAYWNTKLEIDYKKAKKYIDNHFRKDTDQFDSGLSTISMINAGQFFCTVDNTSNRLHSNLTNLATPLRKFLSVRGEKLFSIDIPNSQPTFLALLMSKRPNINPEEVSFMLEICRRGKFYEFMAEKGGVDWDLSEYKLRSEFKKKMFQSCLFDVNRSVLSKWEKVFKENFPSIFNEVRNIKSKNHNELAIMLQREESQFIFSLMKKLDEMFDGTSVLLTVHDSIISTYENMEIILSTMESEFARKYHFYPNLSVVSL